ncbi:MAG: SsrA-binding protein SmpB [Candidatus Ratteibacteria bacterium]
MTWLSITMKKSPKLTNKKAFHDFEILDRIEAGIVLKGSEVKSIRAGSASLRDSYGRIEENELFLYNFSISQYPAAREQTEPRRKKKLLLHAGEIARWQRKSETKGLTIVPLSVYFNSTGRAKVEIALAKGKRMYDKRRALREREEKRSIDRALKQKGAK